MKVLITERWGDHNANCYYPKCSIKFSNFDNIADYACKRKYGLGASFFQDKSLPRGYGQAIAKHKLGGFSIIGPVHIEVRE